jgi:GGDEF domain-containing protein
MQSIEQVNRKSAQASLKAPLHAARSEACKASENLLSKLPVGVLHLSGAGLTIISANSSAKAFFFPIDPVGLGFRDLLALSRASGGCELAAAAEANVDQASVRFALQDGRKLDGFCSPLSEGGAAVTLIDVTRYAHETETALSDALTGLMNRAGLNERLDELLTQSQSRKSQLAVLFLDLDRFKLVNEFPWPPNRRCAFGFWCDGTAAPCARAKS